MLDSIQVVTAKPRVVRSYSSVERQEAIAAYNQTGNLEKVSEALGIPLSTLAGWTSNPTLNSPQNCSNLADKFEFAANLFIDLALKKSKKAAFNHLMTGAGIAVDKSQLLRGLPTAISGSSMSEEDRRRRLAEIFSRLEARAVPAELGE